MKTALEERGIRVRTVLELPSGEGVARAVETGLGIAILSELVVERAVKHGQLAAVEIDDVDLSRPFRLIHLRGRTLSPAAHAFIQLVSDGNTPGIDKTVDPE
jgi:DNA-binding transcriptional LysR family regulator